MLECYNFEECEYNAQPKCCLPNGMECPHGVKAHKPTNADHEKLIERLKNAAGGPEDIKMCQDAATALSTLQAENESLRAELAQADREGISPCTFCVFNPPSSGDGKPCCMCPAVAVLRREQE